MDMQFLPIKLPPVHGPIFYKSTHIALDENHRGSCSGLMVPTFGYWLTTYKSGYSRAVDARLFYFTCTYTYSIPSQKLMSSIYERT